jgi:hypothetical protein
VIHTAAGALAGAVDLSMHVSDCRSEDLDEVIRLAERIEAEFVDDNPTDVKSIGARD